MTKICPLYSGSSGNSTFVRCGDSAVLVDAGVSCKKLREGLAAIGEDIGALRAIFLTHEHSDHIAGLRVLLRQVKVPVYGSAETLRYLWENDLLPVDAHTEVLDPEGVAVDDRLLLRPFDTPHDSLHSVGYRISTADGHEIGIATDMGHCTETVRAALHGCELVLLESNYEPAMLRCSRYPYPLIRRIEGERGHLSNDDCAALACELVQSGTHHLLLGHLSRENNTVPGALQTTRMALEAQGLREGVDFILQVARREEPSTPVEW